MIFQRYIKDSHLVRYIIVGGSAFAVEYISFLSILALIPLPALIFAQTTSYMLGFVVSFLGSVLFTFKSKEGAYVDNWRGQLLKYSILVLFNLIFTNITITLLVNYLSIIPLIAKVLTMACVVVWNFIIFKKIIFKAN